MEMSTHVEGFKPPDEKWHKMKQVYDACMMAKIAVPQEVDSFFEGSPPDEAGVAVDLNRNPCCREFSRDTRAGFEIDLRKLPKDVVIIRFTNSY